MDNEAQDITHQAPKKQSRRRNKSRRRGGSDRPQAPNVEATKVRYPLLCFDTETTNHGELLELSVFDINGNEVYHSYFKPRAKTWPTDIHHITPEMVADAKRFGDCRREVRRLLNSTRYLVGCALSNDITTLRRHGVDIHDRKHTVIEIQNWHWLLNDDSDRMDKHQSGLAAIAETYGLGFGDEQAHSATADTRLTLETFKALAAHFDREYPADDTIEPILSTEADPLVAEEALTRLIKRYDEAFHHAMQVYRMHNASGYINVIQREQGFSLKYNRIVPPENDNIVLSVPVVDRIKAEIDLREHFEPIQLKGFTGIYAMTEADFDYIRGYHNSIDLETFIVRQREINRARNIARAITFRSQKRLAEKAATADKPDQANAQKQTKATKKAPKRTPKPAKTTAARKAMRTARRPTRRGE